MPREIPQYVAQLSMGSMPQVKYTNSQAEATAGMSEQLFGLGESIHKKDMEIAAINADTEMKTAVQRISEEHAGNPESMKAAFDGYRKGLSGSLPSELQAKGLAAWDTYSLTHVGKATEVYKDNQDDRLKLAYLQGIAPDVESGKIAIDGIDSGIPEYETNGYRSLGISNIKLEAMKEAKRHDGRLMFSASEIAAYEKRIESEAKIRVERNRLSPILNDMTKDPDGFILNPDGTAESPYTYKDEKERQKYINQAIEIRNQQQKVADITRVIVGEKANQDLVQAVDAGDPEALLKIEDARNEGRDPVFLDALADRYKKIKPISQERKDEEFIRVDTELKNLGITVSSDGSVNIEKEDATLEDLVRIQRDVTRAAAMGVPNLKTYQGKLNAAIMDKAKNETGTDDSGILWADPTEEFDQGYQLVQDYLDKHDITDNAKKTNLLRKYIKAVDSIPEDVKANKDLYQRAIVSEAEYVTTSDRMSSGYRAIPMAAIQILLKKPETAALFDSHYGQGASRKYLTK